MKVIKIIIIVLFGIILGSSFVVVSKPFIDSKWYDAIGYIILNIWTVFTFAHVASKFSKWFDSKLK